MTSSAASTLFFLPEKFVAIAVRPRYLDHRQLSTTTKHFLVCGMVAWTLHLAVFMEIYATTNPLAAKKKYYSIIIQVDWWVS